jgi:hypothetical protein
MNGPATAAWLSSIGMDGVVTDAEDRFILAA